jgi:Tol biopolymer transport system component
VFHTNLEGQWEVYVGGAGGGKPLRLTEHPAVDAHPSWSGDGKWVYFNSNRSGVMEIWKTPAGPGSIPRQAVQVTRRGGYGALESPDGKWLYHTKTFPVSGLWKMPVEGGEEVQVLEAVAPFAYAVTNDGVYFMKPSGGTAVLQFLDLTTRRVTSIATTEKPASGLTVSPDRRWALFSQMDQQGSDLMLVENFR